jgi:hypothetical protein
MKQRLQIHKKADSSVAKSEQSQPLASHPQLRSQKPVVQAKLENQKLQQYQVEATKLKIQAKYGTITPEGQEQLTVLQTKMNESLQQEKEHSSKFGHNLAEIAIKRPVQGIQPQIQSLSQPIVQPALTVGEPGDKYEQEADEIAASVVNQINTSASQNEDAQQTGLPTNTNEPARIEEILAAKKKEKFLQEYSLAKTLVNDIDQTLPPDKILDQLLKNFGNIQFQYTMVSKSHENLLRGTSEGDCQTLARAFKKVAEEYFGIPKISIESISKPFLLEAGVTPHQGRKPNCDEGKRWFFQNHYWAMWDGKIYDILFLSQQRTEADKAKQVQPFKSMLMPEQDYYETEKGEIVYPYQNKYYTVELSLFEQVKNFVKNLSSVVYSNIISTVISKIRALFSKGVNNSSDFDSLMREVENNKSNTAISTKPNQ